MQIGDVLRLEYGKPLDDTHRNADGRYVLYGANGAKDRTDQYLFDKRSIIIGRKGSAGELTLTEERFWPLDVTYFITFDDRTYDLRFLYYLLMTLDLPSLAKGVKPGINRNEVYSKSVRVPCLAEQQRLAGVLDEALQYIAAAKAKGEESLGKTTELMQEILNSAASGTPTKSWRTTAVSKEGPREWPVVSAESLCIDIVDCLHSTPKWTKSGVVCLRTTNFRMGYLDVERVRYVSEATYRERITRLEPQAGDVVYSREGGILGIACLFPPNLKACLGQRMMHFRVNLKSVLPEYFTAVLNSAQILRRVRKLTSGAASPHLNIRDIKTFPIPLPTIAEQQEIVRRIDSAAEECKRLEHLYEAKLAALESLRKSLLREAFSGNL